MNAALVIEKLAERIRRLESASRPRGEPVVSSGISGIDAVLPGGGFRRGSLVDWIASAPGAGAATLALHAARAVAEHGGQLVLIDPQAEFFPPPAAAIGVDFERFILVRPRSQADLIWTLEQSLRCPGVAAVHVRVGTLNDAVCRRLMLSAEAGQTIGFLVRPASVRRQPVWADARLWVEPLPVEPRASPAGGTSAEARFPRPSVRRLKVQLLAGRRNGNRDAVELELDDETGDVRLAARLEHATTAPPARARRRRHAVHLIAG